MSAHELKDLLDQVPDTRELVLRRNGSEWALYTAWSEPAQRSRWLPDAPLQVRRSTDGKSMRMTWTTGGSRVDVNFVARGPGKSLVQIEHGQLPDLGSATRQKAYWGSALERLKALLEGLR